MGYHWSPIACGTIALVGAAASTAAADPPSAPFVSAGISIGFGTRGLAIGVEVSSGYYSNQSGAYGGAATGFELAVSPDAGEPWGRLYVEAEGGWVAFGAGIGPAWMIGKDATRVGLQVTPYVAIGSFGSCDSSEPFTVVAPFYRYTRGAANHHDGGVFVKQLWFTNGKSDNGVCTH